MGLFDDLFGGGKRAAAKEARKGIQRGIGAVTEQERRAEEAFAPYTGTEQDILGQYRQALGLGADPASYLNQLMGQYQESPNLQAQIQAGESAINRAAAASGMLGSSAHQQAMASHAQQLRSQDLQNFLQNALGLRQQYLSGLGGLEREGFASAEDIARMRQQLGGELMGSYGQLGAARGAEKMARSQGIGGFLGDVGSLFGLGGQGSGIAGIGQVIGSFF